MAFCDARAVRRRFAGKRVAIVGSGPGVLGNAPGFVDSHDVVVRVNNYRILGEVTGQRCDVFYSFFGSSIRKSADELRRDGVNLCMAKCPNARPFESEWHSNNGRENGIDFRYIYTARAGWWFCDTWVPPVEHFMATFRALGNRIPTTGFSAIIDVLAQEPASVYLTGFDFFRSGLHNVTDRWKPGRPDDPLAHDPEAERRLLLNLLPHSPITVDAALTAALAADHAAPQPGRRVRVPYRATRQVGTA